MSTSTTEKPQFLLLLRQPYDGKGTRPDPEQMQQIMARFATWMSGIKARNAVLSSNGLDDRCKIVRGPRGETLSDGPYLEAKEIIGGFVLLTADNFETALAIARDCPGLEYGMAVEVRPVIQH
jgi:hypothetical protein